MIPHPAKTNPTGQTAGTQRAGRPFFAQALVRLPFPVFRPPFYPPAAVCPLHRLSPQFSPTRHRHPGTGVTGAAICFPRAPPRHTVPECRRVFSSLRIKKKNFLRFYANNFLTTAPPVCYINSCPCHGYGGIAQLARACGSYPQCPRFKSRCRYHRGRGTASPATTSIGSL